MTWGNVPCLLPFTYMGQMYDECTTDDNYGTFWCFTGESNYGECNMNTCNLENNEGESSEIEDGETNEINGQKNSNQ